MGQRQIHELTFSQNKRRLGDQASYTLGRVERLSGLFTEMSILST